MFDITGLGELLIDFTEYGLSSDGMRLFEQNPGGAVANVLAAAAKAGQRTAFIGKVGNDLHGRFLKKTLTAAGIDITSLILAEDVFTTLAFVSIGSDGERSFSFARKPGADTKLHRDEINHALLQKTKVLHVGSLSLTDEPARSATFHALSLAKQAGALISYDPNYRPSLWADSDTAVALMRSIVPYVDIMKLSGEESPLLTGKADPSEAALVLHGEGVPCVAITLGCDGALVCASGETTPVAGYAVPVIDTTGAGDAFWGGFLHCLLLSEKKPWDLTLSDAAAFARWGNATAALCVGKRGAIPSIPTAAEVITFIQKNP